jgi:hypothetical protein
MRFVRAILMAATSLALGACSNSNSTTCNVCPGYIALNTGACATEGQTAMCASASIHQITTGGCGSTDAGNIACVATNCQQAFDCTKVVAY